MDQLDTGVMEDAYMMTAKDVMSHFACDADSGLSDDEARSRMVKFG
eukprot:CAMPEP_0196597924 /NCGR_PEP_ID=MMETSP1081-20130531/93739_1 /TAXON_ID=36882 /ORGANISM="Pyramimonas amylifera, Strain CCMP720" /LENGTH=45 /DNA_ID= /DNA_START= /DNA_END= /DNA_ORIENTATION=